MEKNETQESMNKENNNKKIFIAILIVILVVAIIVGIVFLITNFLNKNTIGNTIGNIRNFGAAAEDDKYIYFKSYSEDGLLKTINRIDKNLEKEPEQLIAGSWEISGINVYNDYIYFVTLEETENLNDTINNQIHKMKIDGTEHNVINNNEFHNNCYEIYVVKDKLYYIGEDEFIYKMNLDGTEKTKMNGMSTGFIGITDKYILYNAIEGEDDEQIIVTHIMNLDGTNDRVLTGGRLYCADIIDDTIYYTDDDGHIFKIKIGETNFTMLSNITSYCVNTTSDGIYSLKYIDPELTKQAIFKMDLDGTNEKIIKRLDSTSTFLAVLDDWIIYMDETETEGIIAMVSKDGKKYQELYSIDFEKLLENINLDDVDLENLIKEYVNQTENTNTEIQ